MTKNRNLSRKYKNHVNTDGYDRNKRRKIYSQACIEGIGVAMERFDFGEGRPGRVLRLVKLPSTLILSLFDCCYESLPDACFGSKYRRSALYQGLRPSYVASLQCSCGHCPALPRTLVVVTQIC